MKNISRSIAMLGLFIFSSLSVASTVTPDTLHELIVLSGVKSQVESLSGAVRSGMTAKGKTSAEKAAIVEEALASSLMLEKLSSSLEKALTEVEAKKLVDWYSSNFGARIARAEEAGSTAEAQVEMQKMAQQLLANPARLEKIKEMAAAGNLIDSNLDTQTTLALSAATVIHQQRNPTKPLNVDLLRKITASQVDSMRGQIEMSIYVSMLYIFRDFSVEELDEYLETLKTPEMTTFNMSLNASTKTTFDEAIRDIAVAYSQL